jgi:ketosteroid isomerase-like protein
MTDATGSGAAAAATPAALEIALAYFQSWTSGDLDRAMKYVADDIVCDAPAGRLEGAEAFRGFMGPFAGSLTGAQLLANFGDEIHAVVVYDTQTRPVPSAPGAEWTRVANGRIAHMRIIFDRLPFEEARRAAAG